MLFGVGLETFDVNESKQADNFHCSHWVKFDILVPFCMDSGIACRCVIDKECDWYECRWSLKEWRDSWKQPLKEINAVHELLLVDTFSLVIASWNNLLVDVWIAFLLQESYVGSHGPLISTDVILFAWRVVLLNLDKISTMHTVTHCVITQTKWTVSRSHHSTYSLTPGSIFDTLHRITCETKGRWVCNMFPTGRDCLYRACDNR